MCSVRALALTLDGRCAVSVGFNHPTLHVLDLVTGESLRTLEGHAASVSALGLTLEGYTAALGLGEGERLRTLTKVTRTRSGPWR